jgi:6-phosphogluconolactonase
MGPSITIKRWQGTRVLWALALAVAVTSMQASPALAQGMTTRSFVYAASGPELIQFEVDTAKATLTRRGSVTLPVPVQEGWAHPSKPILYVTWSNRWVGGVLPANAQHGLSAFAVDPKSGALRPLGKPVMLRLRSIYITTDAPGEHVLVALNDTPGLDVFKIQPDGSLGAEVKPASTPKLGIYPHSVRVDPMNKSVYVMARGYGATPTKAEIPSQINIFTLRNGVLDNLATVAPNKGHEFEVRHIDFHPSKPWAFITLEGQNKIAVFQRNTDGTLGSAPLFPPADTGSKPGARGNASIHVHPNGQFVYVSNRGIENSIAVFQINQQTGEVTRIQNIDTQGSSPRTFALDPTGQVLIVANQTTGSAARAGAGAAKALSGSLAVFRIQRDGRLEFSQKYDVTVPPDETLYWMGIVPLK